MKDVLLTIAINLCWGLAGYNLVSLIFHYWRSRKQVLKVPFRCVRCAKEWHLPYDRQGHPMPESDGLIRDIHNHRRMHDDEDRRHSENAARTLQ